MKFKNDKRWAGTEHACRVLTVNDHDGDTLRVSAYIDGKPEVVIEVNESGEGIGITRAKAVKLAWAIIGELDTI